MVFVQRKAHFNAAHRLHNPQKSEAWNKKVYGKCNNPHWHGHNYKLEVTVAGKPDQETGYVIDLAKLKDIIHHFVVDKCDHRNLNMDVSFLDDIIPSTENMAQAFYQQLKEPIEKASADAAFLYAVKLQETERNAAIYCPYLLGKKALK